MSRQDLSGDVIMAEGYEAFISCNRSSKGRGAYSGEFFWRLTRKYPSTDLGWGSFSNALLVEVVFQSFNLLVNLL